MNVVETPWPERVLVIHGTAPADFFTDDELATASEFKLAKRREEWLLSRAAAKQLALELGLATDPRACTVERPLLVVEGQSELELFVSLSHSAPYAGAALAREPVGLDVQVVREFAEWASHLFLSDAEAEQMRACTLPHRVLHFWCAKEAAWKQRFGAIATMKQVPLRVVEQRAEGLRFDTVETVAIGDLIVALTTRAPFA